MAQEKLPPWMIAAILNANGWRWPRPDDDAEANDRSNSGREKPGLDVLLPRYGFLQPLVEPESSRSGPPVLSQWRAALRDLDAAESRLRKAKKNGDPTTIDVAEQICATARRTWLSAKPDHYIDIDSLLRVARRNMRERSGYKGVEGPLDDVRHDLHRGEFDPNFARVIDAVAYTADCKAPLDIESAIALATAVRALRDADTGIWPSRPDTIALMHRRTPKRTAPVDEYRQLRRRPRALTARRGALRQTNVDELSASPMELAARDMRVAQQQCREVQRKGDPTSIVKAELEETSARHQWLSATPCSWAEAGNLLGVARLQMAQRGGCADLLPPLDDVRSDLRRGNFKAHYANVIDAVAYTAISRLGFDAEISLALASVVRAFRGFGSDVRRPPSDFPRGLPRKRLKRTKPLRDYRQLRSRPRPKTIRDCQFLIEAVQGKEPRCYRLVHQLDGQTRRIPIPTLPRATPI